MKSTTYVQFLKGALLIVFSVVITFFVLKKGINDEPGKNLKILSADVSGGKVISIEDEGYETHWIYSPQRTRDRDII